MQETFILPKNQKFTLNPFFIYKKERSSCGQNTKVVQNDEYFNMICYFPRSLDFWLRYNFLKFFKFSEKRSKNNFPTLYIIKEIFIFI